VHIVDLSTAVVKVDTKVINASLTQNRCLQCAFGSFVMRLCCIRPGFSALSSSPKLSATTSQPPSAETRKLSKHDYV